MLNVACCGGAGCCCSEEVKESVKEVVVFVSPTVGGSFVGAIGGGGVSLAVLGFMLVVVCSVSNERAANVVQARRTWRGPVSIDTNARVLSVPSFEKGVVSRVASKSSFRPNFP